MSYHNKLDYLNLLTEAIKHRFAKFIKNLPDIAEKAFKIILESDDKQYAFKIILYFFKKLFTLKYIKQSQYNMIHYRLNRYVHNLELYDKIEEISKYFNYTAQLRGLKTFHYPVNQPIISYEVSVKKPPSQNEKLYFDHEKDSKIEYFDPDKNDFRITRKYEYRKEKHYCFSKIYDVWQRIYAIIYSDSRFLLYQRI